MAPENTLAAIRAAHEEGTSWVEIDIKLSKDGVCFLLHDERLERTTSGIGHAENATIDELAALDAGSWFARTFKGERVPTLRQVIALLGELGLGADLEIKPFRGQEVMTGWAVAREVQAFWPSTLPPPLLSSFSCDALAAARTRAPELPRAPIFARRRKEMWQQAKRLEAVAIGIHRMICDRSILAAAAAHELPVLSYTVNDADLARRLVAAGATSIITDVPARIARALSVPQ